MTEIMLNIDKESAKKILILAKRHELLSSMPKKPLPYMCFLYQEESGGVIAEFTCDDIDYEFTENLTKEWLKDTMLTVEQAIRKAGGSHLMFKWRIRSLIIYQKPEPLSKYGIKKPPKDWCCLKAGDPDGKYADQSAGNYGDMPVMREA